MDNHKYIYIYMYIYTIINIDIYIYIYTYMYVLLFVFSFLGGGGRILKLDTPMPLAARCPVLCRVRSWRHSAVAYSLGPPRAHAEPRPQLQGARVPGTCFSGLVRGVRVPSTFVFVFFFPPSLPVACLVVSWLGYPCRSPKLLGLATFFNRILARKAALTCFDQTVQQVAKRAYPKKK